MFLIYDNTNIRNNCSLVLIIYLLFNETAEIFYALLHQRNVTSNPKKNIFLGALLSLVLAAVISAGHFQYPETFNDMLFWSVIIVVVVANLVNYYRYRRYLRLVEDHQIEIDGNEVSFITGNDKTVLDTKEIVALTFYRRKGQVEHIQLKLGNKRGIRLEGYTDLEQLGGVIADLIPKEQVVGREP